MGSVLSFMLVDRLVIFSNNNISSCMQTSIQFPMLYFGTSKGPSMLTVVNCSFIGLQGYTKHRPYVRYALNDRVIISLNFSSEVDFDMFVKRCSFINNNQLILISLNSLSQYKYSLGDVYIKLDEIIISNNTAASVLVRLKSYIVDELGNLQVTIDNLSVIGNNAKTSSTAGVLDSSVFRFTKAEYVKIHNSNFVNNHGTVFTLESNGIKISLYLYGNIYFINNTGLLGGACALNNVLIQRDTMGNVIFDRNRGAYGGALYLNNIALSDTQCQLKFGIINNMATTSGNSIYFASSPAQIIGKCPFNRVYFSDVNSLALGIQREDTVCTLIPGQNMYINVSITDYFGSVSSCTANVYLLCDSLLYSCYDKQIRLNGPDNVVLVQADIATYSVVDTKLSISAPQVFGKTEVSLLFICKNSAQLRMVVPLNITACPLGFIYNTSEGVCKCADIIKNDGTVICSEKLGVACITQGYWYGPYDYDNTTTYVSAHCSYPDCSYSHKPCPPKMLSLGFAGDYKLLGTDADEQCSVGRGGLLCKSCAEDYQYTFLSVSCVASSTCEWWQPYLVLVITSVFQLMIAMALMIVVRFKIAAGSGFLYGPMLFLAIISHLPLDNDPNFFILKASILIITAVPLLNPEPFGLIPWCFFHPFNKIYNYSLRYLGPLTVLLVIGFATLKAQWCPRTLLKWQNSRLRALCILMLLSFWSLADITMNITFNILTSTRLIHNNDVVVSVVALEPNMKYSSLKHIPIVILSLLVLLIVIIPLLVILLVSPALSRVINLTRIKPFLDEFQSCYRDSCRWYSIVYLIVWIGFVSMQSQAVPMIYIQTLFMIVLSAHCLIRPYQSTVLNMTDTLILIDVNFLIALLQLRTNLTTIILVHILVFVPTLGIGAWFVGVTLVKCGVCGYLHRILFKRRQPLAAASRDQRYEERLPSPPNVPVQEVHLYGSDEEREPLIGIVNDN